ncbi:hypothetical protein HZS_4874 [Henneguya salminicola]|nr:hypothetical protein HZS_4874 [Henneguya salminicola]
MKMQPSVFNRKHIIEAENHLEEIQLKHAASYQVLKKTFFRSCKVPINKILQLFYLFLLKTISQVNKRNASTRTTILKNHATFSSIVYTDIWKAYTKHSKDLKLFHKTVDLPLPYSKIK